MKKFFVSLLIVVFSVCPVFALDFMSANSVTVGWDAVTTLGDGSFVGENDVVTYNVYLVSAQDVDKANPTLLGETAELTYLITMAAEGQFIVGLSSVRNGVESEDIAWSDDPVNVAGGVVFGIQFYAPAVLPKGMYIVR